MKRAFVDARLTALRVALVAVVGLVLCTTSSFAESGAAEKVAPAPYLYELVKKNAFRKSLTKILRGNHPPEWVNVFMRTSAGVATPGEMLKMGSSNYIRARLCKPHDCDANQFAVLFTQDGTQAWAISYVSSKKLTQSFGSPDAEMTAVLLEVIDR